MTGVRKVRPASSVAPQRAFLEASSPLIFMRRSRIPATEVQDIRDSNPLDLVTPAEACDFVQGRDADETPLVP